MRSRADLSTTAAWAVRGLLATLAFLFAVPAPGTGQASAAEPLRLMEEAWSAVDTTYSAAGFDRRAWQTVRDTFQSRDYGALGEAREAIRAMLSRLDDPAVRFLTAEQSASLTTEFAGRAHQGVGLLEVLSVDTNEGTGEIVVVTPVPGGPAALAGLRPGDVIRAVEGAAAKELGLAEVASRLRGPAGTRVELEIRRGGRLREVEITRADIPTVHPVQAFMREASGITIGYVGLRQFTPNAPDRVRRAFDDLADAGAQGWILDLRSNPGGMVPAFLEIAGALLGDVPLARVRGGSSEATLLMARGEGEVAGPMVALVDEGSASAAEILAAALQHHGRATVVGAPTFGKGLVHGLVALSDGSAIMAPRGRLETLDGRDVLEEGVDPDVPVRTPVFPVIDQDVEVGDEEDAAYHRAVELLRVDLREVEGGG